MSEKFIFVYEIDVNNQKNAHISVKYACKPFLVMCIINPDVFFVVILNINFRTNSVFALHTLLPHISQYNIKKL